MAKTKHPLTPADAAALKAFVALARQVKFPGGRDTHDHTKGGEFAGPQCYVTWGKSGGHRGTNVVGDCVRNALAAGFEALDRTRHDVPDGSRIGSGSTYVKVVDGKVFATLQCSTSYGGVAADNYFSLTLTGPKLGRED